MFGESYDANVTTIINLKEIHSSEDELGPHQDQEGYVPQGQRHVQGSRVLKSLICHYEL